MKFCIKDFFSKCDQIRSFLRIWSCLLKKSLIQNFIFGAVVTGLIEKKRNILFYWNFPTIFGYFQNVAEVWLHM